MEHKDDLRYLLGAEELEASFESFLKERTCNIKPSELTEIATASPADEAPKEKPKPTFVSPQKEELEKYPGLLKTGDAVVAENSSKNSASPMDAIDELDEASGAHVADEHATKLELHKHPVAGQYITERTEAVSVDAEWQSVFVDTVKVAVTECNAAQVIERFHKLDRTVFLIKAQQQGLRVALETLLQAESASERAKLLEMDRKYRAARNKGAAQDIRSRVAKAAKTSKPAAVSTKGKSKGMKTADTLKSLMMSKDAIGNMLKQQGLLDEATAAYVEKLFA